MKKLTMIMVICFLAIASFAWATETSKILTFEWAQEDTTNLKEWKLLWGDSSGGDFTEIATIAYDSGVAGPIYSSPETVNVVGDQGTHVLKYFVLRACGDVPQEEGGTEYLCSENSNEVSENFWIPAGRFSVPINFKIITGE
jgi:hypothetical protein